MKKLENMLLTAFLVAVLVSFAYGVSSVMSVPPDLVKGNNDFGHILGA